MNESINQSIDRSIDRLIDQPTNQPTNQSINQSIICPFFQIDYKKYHRLNYTWAGALSKPFNKVARPAFSLTIPTLFEHEIQRCLKRNRKSGYTHL